MHLNSRFLNDELSSTYLFVTFQRALVDLALHPVVHVPLFDAHQGHDPLLGALEAKKYVLIPARQICCVAKLADGAIWIHLAQRH